MDYSYIMCVIGIDIILCQFLAEPWFDRIPRALSAADMYWLRSSAAVFHYAAELFVEISKRVPSGLLTLFLALTCKHTQPFLCSNR